ncbi:MAG: hypothetical protein JWN27_2909 [Candidatus Eremiobacteraeota bacterium]|nr:hypothetical protein [Candidatus Eremiobacteraeota bacterium]
MATEAEATIRKRHHATQDGVVGGHGGICRCSCGKTWVDPDGDCPALDAELEELHRARMDDDGAPHA